MSSKWKPADMGDLTATTAVVTGANAGLGFHIASELNRAGATVVMACRNLTKAQSAKAAIDANGWAGKTELLELDLSNLSSVRTAATSLLEPQRPIDLLVNNAGLMALDQSTTTDGFEIQFGVNHLGHFALTLELLPALRAANSARIVTMSSMGHRMGRMHFDDLMFARKYDRWRPYFQSKLANLLFTAELHRRLSDEHSTVSALAAHPGGSRTDLGTEGKGLTNRAMTRLVPLMTQPAYVGAQPLLRAATDPAAQGGQFFGPRWMGVGHGVVEKPSKRARRADDAARLWSMSEELTGRSWPPASLATT
jgi:protochlorophyllide reductase